MAVEMQREGIESVWSNPIGLQQGTVWALDVEDGESFIAASADGRVLKVPLLTKAQKRTKHNSSPQLLFAVGPGRCEMPGGSS